LWIVLLGSFLFLITVESRGGGIDMPIAGVSIRIESGELIPLPNRIFTCTTVDQQTRCQGDLQDRPLSLVLTPDQKINSDLSDCQALYNGQSISCQNTGSFEYAPMLSESFEVSGLGLTDQQLQAVRQKYWGISTLFAWGEDGLLRIWWALTLSTSAVAAYLGWFYARRLGKGAMSPAWGFISGMVTLVGFGYFLIFTLLGSGFID
jgi:hypothetical protein